MNNKERKEEQDVSSANIRLSLRQKAEEIAQEKENRTFEDAEEMSPEEMREKLHELLVHQIELEMQNDELRRAQGELENARARYLDLYDMAPVGYYTISEKGIIIEINLTAANLLGVARSALIMKPISRFIFKEDQDAYYLHKLKLFETGEPQFCELRMIGRDGAVFWAHLTAVTQQDTDGVRTCRVALSDITERKLKDEELRVVKDSLSAEVEALNRLHTISTQCIRQDSLSSIFKDILNTAMSMSHADKGSIQVFNKQSCSLKIYVHSGFEKSFLERYENVVHDMGGCVKAFQEKRRVIIDVATQSPIFIGTPDLQLIFDEGIESVQSTPMISSSGNILGILSTHYKTRHSFNERELRIFDLLARQAADVLERTRIEEALEQTKQQALDLVEELKKADGNKNNFLSALSHELRNPLATISAGLQLLDISQDVCQTERAKEIMKRQMHQLCRLADDLLDLTRITHNKIELKKEKIELKKLTELVAEDHKALFDEKAIGLDIEITGGSLYLDADPVRIRQSISNLLHNALKFSYTGGRVLLRLAKEKNEALISVADEGKGIKPEFLPYLFQPFMQEDRSIERSTGGLGLGLSIVKGIAELHGGSVSVFSEGIGKGSQFIIRLPILETAEKKELNKNPKGKTVRYFRILLIEDNHDLAEMLRTMLQLMGHTVATAYNGIEGIETAKEFQPEVIFCDIGMPGMDGFETAKRIRNEASLKDLFLIALTGYAGQRDIGFTMESGFNKHLAKPVDRATLEKTLEDVPFCS